MRVKRDNRSFRTRFTTVMISSFSCSPCFSLQSMAQFKWFDGTVKNVHVDPTLLFDYQVCSITLSRTMPAFQMFVLANCQLHVVDAFSILWSSSYLRRRNKLHLHLLMYTQSRINWQTNPTNKKPCLPCCRSSY